MSKWIRGKKKGRSVISNDVFSVMTELVLQVGHTQMHCTMWNAADIVQTVSPLGVHESKAGRERLLKIYF